MAVGEASTSVVAVGGLVAVAGSGTAVLVAGTAVSVGTAVLVAVGGLVGDAASATAVAGWLVGDSSAASEPPQLTIRVINSSNTNKRNLFIDR